MAQTAAWAGDSDGDSYSDCEEFDLTAAEDALGPGQELGPGTLPLLAEEPFRDNPPLLRCLLANADLRFASLPPAEQSRLFSSLECVSYPPGQVVITEGEASREMFFVVSSGRGFEAEVFRRRPGGGERIVTSLRTGQLFGERFFLYRRDIARNASVRVSAACPADLVLARLSPELFPLWERLRLFLLVRRLPLFASLRPDDRATLFGRFYCRVFEEGELILRQGDRGLEFFVLAEGNVTVLERGPSEERVLCSLHCGHFFGEMALLSDEPRVASVRAASRSVCLCLSKEDFSSALSLEAFEEVVARIQADRQRTRRLRPSPMMNKKAKSISDMPVGLSVLQSASRRFSSSREMVSEDSTETRCIAGYKFLSRLGRGAQGTVQLCENAEGRQFAVKVLRPQRRSLSIHSRGVYVSKELEILRRLRHQNIVEYVDSFVDPLTNVSYLVLGLMPTVLMHEEESAPPFPESDCRRCLYSLRFIQ